MESVENSRTIVEILIIFVESFVDFCRIFVELSTNVVETFGVSEDNFSERLEPRKQFF